MQYLERLLTYFAKILSAIAGVAMTALMLLTVTDIIGRNLGLFAVRGIIEIATMSVIFIGFLSLPLVYLKSMHIVVDLLSGKMSERINLWLEVFWSVVGGILVLICAGYMWLAAQRVYESNEFSADLQMPMIWLWVPACIGLTVAGICSIIVGVRVARPVSMLKEGQQV